MPRTALTHMLPFAVASCCEAVSSRQNLTMPPGGAVEASRAGWRLCWAPLTPQALMYCFTPPPIPRACWVGLDTVEGVPKINMNHSHCHALQIEPWLLQAAVPLPHAP